MGSSFPTSTTAAALEAEKEEDEEVGGGGGGGKGAGTSKSAIDPSATIARTWGTKEEESSLVGDGSKEGWLRARLIVLRVRVGSSRPLRGGGGGMRTCDRAVRGGRGPNNDDEDEGGIKEAEAEVGATLGGGPVTG